MVGRDDGRGAPDQAAPRPGGWLRRAFGRLRSGRERPDGRVRSRREQHIVRVTSAPNEPMARLTQQVLEGEGIGVLLKPVGPGYGGWGNANNLMHDVYVLEGDVDRAREIIDSIGDGAGLVLPGDG